VIRVGPAGWSYPDWEGVVYPRAKPAGFHPLAHLLHFVDCVEINSSFYALPRAEHARRWAEIAAARPDFRFLVKLNRDFTHGPLPPPDERERLAAAFLDGIEPLIRARKVAALLIQFPVGFLYGPTEVRRLGTIAAPFRALPLAVELRHDSWFAPPALATLRGLGLSLLTIDLPPAWNHPPGWHEPTGPLGYLRLHGRNSLQWFRSGAGRDDRYDYLYSPRELAQLADKARRLASRHDDVYVVTNNHFEGQAVANAIELKALLAGPGGERPSAPPELVERFPRLSEVARVEGQQRLF